MDLDDKVCLCFRVTKRKLVNYLRRELPRVPSQLSECGGAGTGCGWCIPFLKQLFRQEMSEVVDPNFSAMTAAEYARQRADYIRIEKKVPPPGAEPLPEEPIPG